MTNPWSRAAKTAKDANRKTIRRGDTVTCVSIYDGTDMNVCIVVDIQRQGYDGTILTLDRGASVDYPHYRHHKASMTRRH